MKIAAQFFGIGAMISLIYTLLLKSGQSKKITNPNPSPTRTMFGFVLFGAA